MSEICNCKNGGYTSAFCKRSTCHAKIRTVANELQFRAEWEGKAQELQQAIHHCFENVHGDLMPEFWNAWRELRSFRESLS